MSFRSWFDKNFSVVRDRNGVFSYWLNGSDNFGNNSLYLDQSLNNPVAFICISARANIYSQMKILHLDKNGDEIKDSKYVERLTNPNYFQSGVDFLKQQMWNLSATGNNLTYQKKIITQEVPTALYNLVPSEIDYSDINKIDKFVSLKKDINALEKQTIQYTLEGKTLKIPIYDLIPFYDVANGLKDDSFFRSPSRLKSVQKPLCNIDENLKAKNINLQFAQKFLASNETSVKGNSVPTKQEDKDIIRDVLRNNEIQVTNGNIKVQHLVEDMKRLFLDEQLAFDAKLVAMAFEQNESILNFGLNGGLKYENQRYGIINYIQSSIQNDADNTMNTYTNEWGLDLSGEKLVASYSHLPIMQEMTNKKIESFNKFLDGIEKSLSLGLITQAEAIEKTERFANEIGL